MEVAPDHLSADAANRAARETTKHALVLCRILFASYHSPLGGTALGAPASRGQAALLPNPLVEQTLHGLYATKRMRILLAG